MSLAVFRLPVFPQVAEHGPALHIMPVEENGIRPGQQFCVFIHEDRAIDVMQPCCIMIQEEGIVLLCHRLIQVIHFQPAHDILTLLPGLPDAFVYLQPVRILHRRKQLFIRRSRPFLFRNRRHRGRRRKLRYIRLFAGL